MNAQPDLFGAPLELEKARADRRSNLARDIAEGLLVDVPMSRNDHPETSHEAGEYLHRSGARASMQRTIRDFVSRFPGCILLEIAAGTGIEKHNVASRLAELKGSSPPLVRQGDKREMTTGNKRLRYLTWWPAT